MEILYSPLAMIIAQIVIIFPIMITLIIKNIPILLFKKYVYLRPILRVLNDKLSCICFNHQKEFVDEYF